MDTSASMKNRKPDYNQKRKRKEKSKAQFEPQQQVYTCSRTFNSTMWNLSCTITSPLTSSASGSSVEVNVKH